MLFLLFFFRILSFLDPFYLSCMHYFLLPHYILRTSLPTFWPLFLHTIFCSSLPFLCLFLPSSLSLLLCTFLPSSLLRFCIHFCRFPCYLSCILLCIVPCYSSCKLSCLLPCSIASSIASSARALHTLMIHTFLCSPLLLFSQTVLTGSSYFSSILSSSSSLLFSLVPCYFFCMLSSLFPFYIS